MALIALFLTNWQGRGIDILNHFLSSVCVWNIYSRPGELLGVREIIWVRAIVKRTFNVARRVSYVGCGAGIRSGDLSKGFIHVRP